MNTENTDNNIIEEAVRLVEDGVSVTLPVGGHSMLPFIIGGRESVILQKPAQTKIGDVILAWVVPGRWVVHRVIRIEGEHVTLMGDGNLSGTESCTLGDVVLAWVVPGRWVVHRVIRIDGDNITLMGDGNLRGTESCTLSDVKALITYVVDANGKRRDVYTRWRRIAARLWWHLRPFRRYILAIYRRI